MARRAQPSAAVATFSLMAPLSARDLDQDQRFVALSSTTRTRNALELLRRGNVAHVAWHARRAPGAAVPSRTVRKNGSPRPASLSTQTRPPIISTSCVVDRKPEAGAAELRVVEPRPGRRLEDRLLCFSAGMPDAGIGDLEMQMPGAILARSVDRPAPTTSPRSVNLIALPTRLIRTCRSRPGSPTNYPSPLRMSAVSSRPFSSARMPSRLRSRQCIFGAKSIGSRSSFPASIFEKSRMSLKIPSRESAELFTIPDIRCSCGARFGELNRSGR